MPKENIYEHLKRKLRRKLSWERFQHSVAVGEWAAELGKVHGWDPERARLAGLLHDYAKEWSPKKMKKYVKKHKLKIPDLDFILACSPNMMHAYIGADVVRRKKWISHKKDLSAMAAHTIGKKKMGLEDKVLFIADFSAPGRSHSSAEAIRKIALKNLEQGFRETMKKKMEWCLIKQKPIHPFAVRVWNRLCGVKQ